MKKRILALLLAACLSVCLLAGCAAESTAAQASAAAPQPTATPQPAVHTDTSGVDKQETVYAKANADGTVTETTVEAVLKAVPGGADIADKAALSDIKNTEGDEEYTAGANGALTWQNHGEAITYEGKSQAALPVTVRVTYYLDGQEIEPEKLAGQSGQVRIRFDYVNHTAVPVTIDGQTVTVCVPFTALTALVLDSDRFYNVETDNGAVMEMDGSIAVIGAAMPGLADTLLLSEYEPLEDTEIPSYFEVTADAVDFELDFTATVLSPETLNDADLSDLDEVDDLVDSMDELTDGIDELTDGTGELADGVQELYDGFNEYADGVKALNEGCEALKEGLDALYDNQDALNTGARQIADALAQLDAGLSGLDLSDMTGGDLTQLTQAAEMLNRLGAALADPNTIASLNTLAQEEAKGTLTAVLAQDDLGLTEEQRSAIQSAYDAAVADALDLSPALTEMAGYAQQGGGALQTVAAALGELQTQFTELEPTVAALQSGVHQLAEGSGQLAKGIETYCDGIKQLSWGADALAEGSAELDDASAPMREGLAELHDGTVELRDGVQEFGDDGVDDLKDLAGEDLQNVVRRLRAAQQAGKDYQTFSGLADGKTGSVRFIVETAEIKK